MIRLNGLLHYDRNGGVRVMPPQRPATIATCTTTEQVALALAAWVAPGWRITAYLAGYGLALAARTTIGQPDHLRQATMIQSAQLLRDSRPYDTAMRRVVERAHAHADQAIHSGANAEEAILQLVERELQRADQSARQCGPIGAELLESEDILLVYGSGGLAFGWMLGEITSQAKPAHLYATEQHPDLPHARMAVEQSLAAGIPATLLDAQAARELLATGKTSLCLAAAEQIADDGSFIGLAGTTELAIHAQRHHVPVYIFGPWGANPDTPDRPALAAQVGQQTGIEIVPSELVSAFITSRGIYRPAMIARNPDDGQMPVDVIPLL